MLRKEITKQEINELELFSYNEEIKLIETINGFNEAIKDLKKQTLVGFDTESKPSFKKGIINNISLIQVATANRVYLIRINMVGFPKPLVSFLNDSKIIKVGIGLDDDIQRLSVFSKINPESFLDLNDYCEKRDFLNIGARNLSAMILNIRISKNQQTSNWELDKLSESQLRYAATDAWICREIYLKLKENGL